MDAHYPPGPSVVPPDLTAPSSAYKRHAWLAMLGLMAFIVSYFALSAWFALTAWRLLGGMFGASGNSDLWSFLAGMCAAFLAVFMLKALFFIQHRYEIEDIEVTREQEPQLFDFIDRLADEARAPRAHKVYLSPQVNAAVFYDLSLLNLIIPSKKNLKIGLGLVNVLSLGELKAVLAHEFGHFAQRSMAVDRWVYIAHQIAGHVVARRDALDKLLQSLSRIDLRLAWIGWGLSMIVWSIRSTMDVLFRVTLLAQRALSRQMEFQADLVAVSLTGSDALIHALHRLNAADDAWDRTFAFLNREAASKHGIADLFAVHTRIIERMREILNQPNYGVPPPMPAEAQHQHRVFKSELAQPPRMWLTHPPSADREHNAKQRYVAAPVDERSAWVLFREPQALKERMSAHVVRKSKLEPVPMETTLEHLDKEYSRKFHDRKYHGIYLRRSPVRHVATAADLYGTAISAAEVPRALAALYPESLAARVEELNDKQEEKKALEALRDEVAQAPGGIIRYNGVELRRAELPRVIAGLEQDIAAVRAVLEAHDRDCRTAHLAAATILQKGWPEYLQGLAAVLLYADHSEANLRDAQRFVSNTYRVVTADGRVSSSELSRLISACQELYRPLQSIFIEVPQVTLDRTLLARLKVDSWQAMLEEFKLGAPSHANISQWLDVIDGWIGVALTALSRLRVAALEQLLAAESQVAKFTLENMVPGDAPPASAAPREYLKLMPGDERPLQTRLNWWDRFQVADGALPMIARSVVAVGIVGAVVLLGARVGEATLTIFNSLAQPVQVEVGGTRAKASPFTPVSLVLPASGRVTVRTLTADDEVIETFDEVLEGANAKYVYNVAGAAPLVQWTAVYSSRHLLGEEQPGEQPRERPIGAPRWSSTHVDHIFEEPPRSIQTSGGNGYREVLSAATDAPVFTQAEMVSNADERAGLIRAHVRWDATLSPNYQEWMQLASKLPDFDAMFAARLKQSDHDVVLLRFEQDNSTGAAHAAVCERHRAAAEAAPDQPDPQYLAIRCLPEDAKQQEAFIAAQKKWPDHPWLTYAAAVSYAVAGDYQSAAPLYEKARHGLPPMKEYIAVESARMRRLTGDGDSNLSDLAADSQRLGMFLAIETGNGIEGTALEPFTLLARGDLEAAASKAGTAPDNRAHILRLVAASDRATPKMMSEALALPIEESSDLNTMFAMYGLAARLHHDTAPYIKRLEVMMGTHAAPALDFVERVRRGEDPVTARAALPTWDLGTRLCAINAAVVMLGERAPAAWRKEVARGLFIGERQYIDLTASR